MISWQDRRRTIRAGSLGDAANTPTIGSAGYCPTAAGSAALASQTVDSANNVGVQLALQSAGGAFAPFAPLALPAGVDADGTGLAVGGGILAMGASRDQGGRPVAVLLVRGADGVVRPVSLPGGLGNAKSTSDLVGPVTGIDGAGRGLVVWGAGHKVGGQLLAARFDATGALGPVQVLAADGVDAPFDQLDQPRISVAPDGTAAVGWVADGLTTVTTGRTTAGFDPGSAASTPVHWTLALAPNGAAAAVDASPVGQRARVRIATRAAGQPFSAPGFYRAAAVPDEPPAVAVDGGRYLFVFAEHPMVNAGGLGLLRAVAGRAGARPGAPVTVPISSAEVPGVAAALPPNGPPTVLTTTQRSIECGNCHSSHARYEIDAFHFSGRPPRPPRGVSVRVASSQRLGHPQALTVRVTCPRRCAVRIAGSVSAEAGDFDTSRRLRSGNVVVRVPYVSGGGSGPFRPLRHARRTRLGIAVDDGTGELRVRRSVLVRP